VWRWWWHERTTYAYVMFVDNVAAWGIQHGAHAFDSPHAEKLTALENHRTAHAHRTSLIFKRICFEAFDCYIALFYLAFWQCDVLKVRAELKALFTGDCARRLATEVLLPWASQRFSAASRQSEARPS
jgi:Calcium-activated chloride channel